MRKTDSSGHKHDDENDSDSCTDSARNINVDGGGGDDGGVDGGGGDDGGVDGVLFILIF